MKEIPSEKICDPQTGCGQKKPSSEFHRAGFTKDGLQRLCKVCQKKWQEDGRQLQKDMADVSSRFNAAGPFAKTLAKMIQVEGCQCEMLRETFRKGGRPDRDYICYDHEKAVLASLEKNTVTIPITITNNHIPSCGNLPSWALQRPDNSYFGYFENRHREQWVFLATQDQMRLAGGDVGWDELYEETKPDWKALEQANIQPGVAVLIQGLKSDAFKDLVLDFPEAAWLTACIRSAAEHFGGHPPII